MFRVTAVPIDALNVMATALGAVFTALRGTAPAMFVVYAGISALELARLTYAELAERLRPEPSERLVALLDERSIKVGDTAADLLSSRGETALVLYAVMSGRLTTRNGKVRALNFFCQRGRKTPEALPAYLRLIQDANPDVVDCALFGLVFWNDPQHLPAVRAIDNPRAKEFQEKAIAALEARNPKLYSPYFHDAAGVWKTNEVAAAGG